MRWKYDTPAGIAPGDVFGSVTVIAFAGRTDRSRALFEVKCECGSVTVVRGDGLKGGTTRHCSGAVHRAHTATNPDDRRLFRPDMAGNKLQQTHGYSGTRAWVAWIEMKRRCDPKRANWPRFASWAGRGITVCERWANSFERFFEDMGQCPDGLQLDRIDTNGNYEPGNCRWATVAQQQNNRRSNIVLEIDGKTQTIAQWARQYGVRPRTAAQRLRAGWPAKLAVSRESDRGQNHLCA